MNVSGSKKKKSENGGLKNHQFRVYKIGFFFSDLETFIIGSGNAIVRDGLRLALLFILNRVYWSVGLLVREAYIVFLGKRQLLAVIRLWDC